MEMLKILGYLNQLQTLSNNRVLLIFFIFVFIAKDGLMSEKLMTEVEEFKKNVGFDLVCKSVDNSKSVVYWKKFDIMKFKSLQSLISTAKVVNEINIRQTVILKEIEFNTEKDQLSLEIFIFNENNNIEPLEKLLNKVSFTTMTKIMYEKCPYNLGNLNVWMISNKIYYIKWTYYNIYFSVAYSGNSINIEQFCRELQQYTEAFVVSDIERYRPRFDEIIVSSKVIKVGEEVTVYVVPAYGRAFGDKKVDNKSNFHLEALWEGKVLSLEKEAPFFFRFKGITEGEETINLILADLDALVCSKHSVIIKVTR